MKEKGITRRELFRVIGRIGLATGTFYLESNIIIPPVFKAIVEGLRPPGPPKLVSVPDESILFGVSPHNNDLYEAEKVSDALERQMHIISVFDGSNGEVTGNIYDVMKQIITKGQIPMYSWYPTAQRLNQLPEDHIRRGAQQLRSLEGTILFRPLYEMNGLWFSWNNNNTPQEVVTCWRRIRNIFREESALNVKFVFSPILTINSRPIEPFFPGLTEVDAVSLDIYDQFDPSWLNPVRHLGVPDLSPDRLIGPDLSTFLAIAPGKPFLITEIGSMSRPEWVSDAIRYVATHFPKTIGIIPFDWNKEGKGMWEANWQILRSPQALKTTRRLLAEPYFYQGSSPQEMIASML